MAEKNNYKKGSFLDQLTKGLYDAVVSAQALSENQHIEALSKYFDDQGNPIYMKMKIPGDNGKDQDINIPMVTLAPQSSIKIKELTMELKVRIGSFGKRESRKGGGIFRSKDAGAIGVDLGCSILPKKNQYASLKITFEGSDPPEGLVRINNTLLKQIP